MARKSIAIIGSQWGDEGKGKFVDLLTRLAQLRVQDRLDYDPDTLNKQILVRRYQGSDNAGHTLVVDGVKYALHLTPSGILIPEAYNLIGQQVFVNPRAAIKEIKGLIERGVPISSRNLGIAANAHMTLQYHVDEDTKYFESEKRSSTGKGVAQTSRDKQARIGVRFVEFLDPNVFREALGKKFPQGIPEKYGSFEEFLDSYAEERDFLEQFVVQDHEVSRLHGSQFEIWEGAQGVMLDVDVGEYPGTTSSNPSFIPGKYGLKLGILKLYNSSAGTGGRPFVGQMEEELESRVRKPWYEFGTTTDLERDVGWFDVVAAKYAVEAAEMDYLAGTCGDKMELLAQLGEKAKLVVGYKKGSKTYSEWNAQFHKRGFLKDAEPVFEEFEPWKKFSENDQLTPNAQRYVDRIQELTGREFIMYGTGPGRNEIIINKDPWNLV